MGSLMAGWNSPRSKKKIERNMSLTKDEIDHYWRNRRLDQAQVEASSSPPSTPGQKELQKSYTFSGPDVDAVSFNRKEIMKHRTFNGRQAEVEVEPECVIGSAPAAWWTKTDLAFLNERPVLEIVQGNNKFKYVPQFKTAAILEVDESPSSSTVVF